jgi:uncharacterized membrane protein YbhN (UPF0104 family)
MVGGVMFAVAVWVLRGTLARYDLADLHAELAALTLRQVGLAVLFTGLSFVALVGYEFSALRMIGKRVPLGQMALASFATQSIAHSTGFAFVVGATLRYNFYAGRGIGLGDVAKIQVFFTATFTLGVATLAGAVVAVEPWRLAHATGLPAPLWRAAAGTGLALVVAYVVWGAFFHRPFRWRGREFALPSAGATLTQIFFGVADLVAVAAALHVLLPAELGLGYAEVLAIFMASIVVGLMSHVPGSLGVFESAVILLVQPSGPQTLPLVGALLAFRGIYYLLPLTCGVAVLAATELRRWRGVARRLGDRARLDLGPGTPQAAAALTFVAGLALLLLALAQQPAGPGPLAPSSPLPGGVADLDPVLAVTGGVALLLLAHGVAQRLAAAWRWALAILLVAALAGAFAGVPVPLRLFLAAVALLLFACRGAFARPAARADMWQSPAWVMLVALTVASGFWLAGHG